MLAAAMVAACVVAPAGAGAPAPEPRPFVPESLLAAAEAKPDAVFPVIVQGRDGKDSRAVANEVAAERARTPGGGQGVGRRFRTISGVSAELSGKQILRLATKRWILAITPDAPMVATEGVPPANTVPPTVSGTAQQEQTLSAAEGLWSGTEPLAYAYQWQRCDALGGGCVDVAEASAASYTLAAADVGVTVRVVVTASNVAGSASATSEVSAVVAVPPPFAPANTVAPTLSGTAREGETLTASEGLWSGTFPLAFGFQWQRCDAVEACVDIVGATDAAYLLAAVDVGVGVRVVVTASNAAGSASAASAQSVVVAAAAPLSVAPPSISGVAGSGLLLSASAGSWSGTAPIGYGFQWQRSDALGVFSDIDGATSSSFVPSAVDVGFQLRVRVTASNAGGSASALSGATAAVLEPPASTAAPTIAGSLVDGGTLSATSGGWSGTGPLSYAYQWQRCDATGLLCGDVAGATGWEYVLGVADVGSTIRVRVTASNGGGSAGASSAATVVVLAAAPLSVAPPSISGVAGSGLLLSAWAGSWSGTAPIGYGFQWQRCDAVGACVDIAAATDATYLVAAADVGASVRVVVTASNGGGSASAVSLATAAVQEPPANAVPPSIAGSLVDGESLSASEGSWSGTLPLAFGFQWQRCDAVEACVDIVGATGVGYVLSAADAGLSVRVSVTASNGVGAASASSAISAAVAAAAPVNTVVPAVSGTAAAGLTLSVSVGSWSGTAPLSFGFQWQRSDAVGVFSDIAEATNATYLLAAADVGSTVRVVVTASNGGGSASAASTPSAVVVPLPPASLSPPALSGTAEEGASLGTSTGAWSGTPPLAFAYQWQRCDVAEACVDIAGATTAGYTLAAADVGASVRVVVTASNAAGSASAASAPSAVVVPLPPASLSPPTLSGTAEEGTTLASSTGAWSAMTALAFLYQWQRCSLAGDACTDIAGATAAGYILAAADVGATVRVVVTASNAGGSVSAVSEPSAAIAPARLPVETVAPTIAGTTEDAQTLTASSGSWMGTEPFAHAYHWQRCDGSGGACADIPGATGTAYSLTPADVGSTIRVVVTTSNIAGSASATSPATTAVSAAPPGNLVQPKVVGGAEEGLMLTAAEGRWSGTPSLAFTYLWQRCDAEGICADIPGATAPTYLLVAADLGAAVQVIVTATNAAGTAIATSPRTAAVAPTPVLTGFSTRQHWPYAAGVPRFWTDRSPAGPAIAIVDSGIQAERADFGGRVVTEVTLTTLTPNSPGDGRGHGTFVASIAAGEAVGYTGADPSATLVSIDVLNDEGQALTSDVIAAADWIYENKALYDIRVANFSITGSVESSFRFDPVNKAVEKLWLSGVVVVAAAGNYAVDGQESGVRFTPGNDPFVITVGATDVNGSVSSADDFAAPWSAYGYTVDGFAKPELGAPGRYMVGAVPPSSRLATERPDRVVADGYMQLSGTSFAAPIVAGIASALLAAHPTWTPDQVKGALMLTAEPTAALQPFSTGVGAIDAAGAADLIDPPNPNAALNQFLIADPLGGPVQVFDEAGWAATAQADPAWSSSYWGSSYWGSAWWSVSYWGSVTWSSSYWGSEHWGSDTAPASGDSYWGSIVDRADDDALPAGGYWITSAERAAAEEALGLVPAP